MFSSCKRSTKDQLIGAWKMAQMNIQYYDKQKEMNKKQIAMWQDSISKNTDTAKINKFQKRLTAAQKNSTEFQARLDSALKNSRMEFKSNGDFIDNQSGTKKNGLWSFDEEKMILFTIVNNQTNSVHVNFNEDTFIMQFDSLNYMKFSRVK
jgi:hypothetical protein